MLKLLDTLISMSLVYLILAVLASALTEAWSSAFDQRARYLRLGLTRLLGGAGDGSALPAGVAASVINHPWIANTADAKTGFPSYVTPQAFSGALVDSVLKLGPAPPDAAWDAPASFARLRLAVDAIGDTTLKASMQALINEGEQSIQAFRTRAEALFDVQMNRVSGWYKRYAQRITLAMGFVLVFLLNADSIQTFSDFWTNARLRETATSMAAALSEDKDLQKKVVDAQQKLLAADLRLGWLKENVAEGCSWPTGSAVPVCSGLWSYLTKLVGLLITCIAITLGAHFWFESMSTLLNIRNTGPQKKGATEPQAGQAGQDGVNHG